MISVKKLRALACVACSLLAAHGPVTAEPLKPVCVVPAKPGGGFDLTCRIAAAAFEGRLKTPMQVTYLPGGIGAAAYKQFATTRSREGNALVAHSSGSLLNIAVGKYGNFTADDVRFVASAGADYGAIVVRADSRFDHLGALMRALKTAPGGVLIGAGGSIGSQDWVKGALLMQAAGSLPKSMRYVAFDGGGEAISNLISGNIDVYTGDISELRAHVNAGKMRVLAVLADKRLPAPFQNVPTAKEQGVDVNWTLFRGFYMGKNVSDADYQFYADAFAAAYKTPEFARIREEHGLYEFSLSGQAFHDHVKRQVTVLRELVNSAGLLR
ncbi:MAG: tripartite tricarboxylate transporter substrate-binding protein [Rhodoferax sp.]